MFRWKIFFYAPSSLDIDSSNSAFPLQFTRDSESELACVYFAIYYLSVYMQAAVPNGLVNQARL